MGKYVRKGGWGGSRKGAGRKKKYYSLTDKEKDEREHDAYLKYLSKRSKINADAIGPAMSELRFRNSYKSEMSDGIGDAQAIENIISDQMNLTISQSTAQAANLKNNLRQAREDILNGTATDSQKEFYAKFKEFLGKTNKDIARAIRSHNTILIKELFNWINENGAYDEALGS